MQIEPLEDITHVWEANSKSQGTLGDFTELANVINARVVGLLHWEVKNIYEFCTVRLHQVYGFSFLLGEIIPVVTVLTFVLSCSALTYPGCTEEVYRKLDM